MPTAGSSVGMDGTLREVEGGFDAFICHGRRSKVGRVHVLWRRGGIRTGTLEVRVRRPPGSRWSKTPMYTQEDPHIRSAHGTICLSAISADCAARLVLRALDGFNKGDEMERMLLSGFPRRFRRATWNRQSHIKPSRVPDTWGRGGGRRLPCLHMPPLPPRFPFTAHGNPGRHQRKPLSPCAPALFTLRSGQLLPHPIHSSQSAAP